MAYIYYVDKPIADKGYISNYQLLQIINKKDQYSTILSVLGSIPTLGLGSAAQAVAQAFGGGGGYTRMEREHGAGNNVYWCELYASGVDPSLSKEARVVYSDTQVIFRER